MPLTDAQLLVEALRRIRRRRGSANHPALTDVTRDGDRVRGVYLVAGSGGGVETGVVEYTIAELEQPDP